MRGSQYLSQHEASEYRRLGSKASKAAQDYRQKWLILRAAMRSYLPEDIPEDIKKLIGRKS
jgi:hypothetical protein